MIEPRWATRILICGLAILSFFVGMSATTTSQSAAAIISYQTWSFPCGGTGATWAGTLDTGYGNTAELPGRSCDFVRTKIRYKNNSTGVHTNSSWSAANGVSSTRWDPDLGGSGYTTKKSCHEATFGLGIPQTDYKRLGGSGLPCP
jgi:hypothetical protein